MEYYKNEKGQIAVLVSGCYGAGWSTWNVEELAYDKRVVEFWLSVENDLDFLREVDRSENSQAARKTKDFLASIGYFSVYLGGFADIHVEWVDAGQPFRIDEYDGFESLVTLENTRFTTLV